ncbi:MAG: DUF432 domain-containing protein [Desulfurococcaceae archaeon]
MIFGSYQLTERIELNLPRGALVVEKISENIVRITKIINGASTSKLISTQTDSFITLKAIPPIGGSLSTNCIYATLPEPVTLTQGTRLQYDLKLPVDLGIFIGGDLVDVVPLGKVKYALYGPPDIGDICRYSDLSVINSYNEYIARAKVIFKTLSNVKTEISRLVIPIKEASVYLTEENEMYFSDIEVTVLSPLHVEIRVGVDTSYILLGKLISLFKGSGAFYVMKHCA